MPCALEPSNECEEYHRGSDCSQRHMLALLHWKAAALYNLQVEKQAGIYIHIPFCERKCTYCNFNTADFDSSLAARYLRAVEQEIILTGPGLANKSEPGRNKRAADTIYFGGGTPSIVEAEQLGSLVRACRDSFDVAEDAEITIEINPATLSDSKLDGWLAAGINRASVGVQSFIDRELQSLSRTHNAEGARQTLAALRRAGFQNISLDLIAGLPAQTLDDWKFNLREALALGPEHLSLYLLEIKEGTQLFAQIKRGARPLPDDDLAAEMYRMICEATREAGYEQYEISNFALKARRIGSVDDPAEPDQFRSKHNLKYWTGAPFYGIGCGAHSYDGQARWVNLSRTESYIEAVVNRGCALAERHELSDEDRAAEALFMGLRLIEGIDLEEFRAEYRLDVRERFASEVARLEEADLVAFEQGRLRLTDRGLLLSNEVFVSFV